MGMPRAASCSKRGPTVVLVFLRIAHSARGRVTPDEAFFGSMAIAACICVGDVRRPTSAART